MAMKRKIKRFSNVQRCRQLRRKNTSIGELNGQKRHYLTFRQRLARIGPNGRAVALLQHQISSNTCANGGGSAGADTTGPTLSTHTTNITHQSIDSQRKTKKMNGQLNGKSSPMYSVHKPTVGQELERVLCVYRNEANGQLCHLVKWKGSDKCQVCDSRRVNRKWPQLVIAYYQKNLKFGSIGDYNAMNTKPK